MGAGVSMICVAWVGHKALPAPTDTVLRTDARNERRHFGVDVALEANTINKSLNLSALPRKLNKIRHDVHFNIYPRQPTLHGSSLCFHRPTGAALVCPAAAGTIGEVSGWPCATPRRGPPCVNNPHLSTDSEGSTVRGLGIVSTMARGTMPLIFSIAYSGHQHCLSCFVPAVPK